LDNYMKTLILNAPWAAGNFYGVRAGSRWPHLEESAATDYMPFPFFMGYAAAVLERAGKPVEIIDACAERLSDDSCLSRIKQTAPDLIAMESSTPTTEIDIAFARKLKEHFPNSLVAFCGANAMVCDPGFMRDLADVDFVFRGEYEMILLELVEALEKGDGFNRIKGLMFRKPEGKIEDNGPRPLLRDIDSLPWPARHLFKMHLYSDRPGGIPLPSLQLWSSRGCPFTCIFCVWPQIMYGGNRYRPRNPTDVVDELEYCLKKWPFKSFYFDDDTFNVGKERILALTREIRTRKINLPWAVMARADLVDREILSAMKEAGMVAIKYGMESGVQELIDASGKRLQIEDVEKALRLSKELGIEVHLTFTFGLPGETKETVKQTIRKAIEMDPFSVQFSIATPFPGTEYFRALKVKGHILSEKWEQYSGSTGAVHRTDALSKDDLDDALCEAQAAWNLHRLTRSQRFPALILESMKHPVRAFAALQKVLQYHIRLR